METEDPVPAISLQRNSRRRWSGRFSIPTPIQDTPETETPIQDTPEDGDLDQNENPNPTVQPRRSKRKKINMSLPEVPEELPKPKKLTEKSSLREIKNYYTSKHVKILNPSLETIFEEPQQVRNEEVMMSTRKFRRSIIFKPTTVKNPAKIKKRKLKAKQVLANKKPKKVSLEFLMDKLAEIDE